MKYKNALTSKALKWNRFSCEQSTTCTHIKTETHPQPWKALQCFVNTGHGSPVWRKCITAPAAILRLNPLSSPQAAIETLQFQLYCCYQLLHAAWVMSPPDLSLSHTPPPSISWTDLNISITAYSTTALYIIFSTLSWAILRCLILSLRCYEVQ